MSPPQHTIYIYSLCDGYDFQRGSDTQDGTTTWHFRFQNFLSGDLLQFQWKNNNFEELIDGRKML